MIISEYGDLCGGGKCSQDPVDIDLMCNLSKKFEK